MSSEPYNGRVVRNIRNFFICLNYDLFEISNNMQHVDRYSNFNEFEYYVMALEDRRFLKHGGYDLKSLFREVGKCIMMKKHGGASTIDMQMVRTLTNFRDLTLYRKIYEIILSVLINYKFSKKQIIRCYLSNAFFGSGLYGFEITSIKFFGKEFPELNADEQAFLAAMLLRPKPLKPTRKWADLVHSRASYAQKMRVFVKDGDD